jgi:DNA (cytosine-5)-methyltransferase 1
MAEYFSTKEIADRWGITSFHVSVLCSSGRIPGAVKQGKAWKIPCDAKRPKDNRVKEENFDDCKFTFIDLFAGIGGFHQAMRFLGGKCVMASEINLACVETYKLNYKTKDVRGDIKKIEADSIGKFDVLCAGFPCQPFSKAGLQKGFGDEDRGNLFFNILRILDGHSEVKFIILENVRNLADKDDYWNIIKTELMKRDFFITEKPIILSPSNFGLPQIRERVYILGIRKDIRNTEILTNDYIHIKDLGLENIQFKDNCKMGDAFSVLEKNVSDEYAIDTEQEEMILAWEEFRKGTNIGVIGFPIWIKSFGYQVENEEEFLESQDYNNIPDWKKKFVRSNRKLYLENKDFIDEWIVRHNMINRIKLYQKFEWNCGADVKDIHDAVIQVRQSGIRVKRPTYYPALVAIVNTPIIYDKQKKHFRHITPREAANLQNFDQRFKFTGTDKQTYSQLGNSVNVKILKILGKKLFAFANDGWEVHNGEKD